MGNGTFKLIDILLKKPSFTSKDARAKGVHPSLLAYYAKAGYLERISRGVYRGLEKDRRELPLEWEDLIATAQSIPRGVICLISALAIYQLTDEIPRQFWIAVPQHSRPPKRPNARIIRMRDMKTGATRIKLGSATIKIFDPERSVIDAFRCLEKEIALKALRSYLEGKYQKPDIKKLLSYSKVLRTLISSYIEALIL
ncbi:MAG: hypothetical protein GYA55_14080 [SAR324 cluster bacterium]|uniref:AbiEi antitoxin N-terminal domain-containing protein n=1 Tax=SAR324 cluster bacterium TaxID=2024889 RepID=A0A7X9IKN2_9DELT|nr:hypothetical protein [SAR324 cluster bacterium]